MSTNEAINRFQKAIKPFLGTWTGIDVKWIATKTTPSKLLAFHGLLTSEAVHSGKDLLDNSKTVEARREILDLNWLETLQGDLSSGHVTLGGIQRQLEDFSDFRVVKDYFDDSYSFKVEQPNIWLRTYGRLETVDQEGINRDLATIGYMGLYEAAKDTLGFFVGGSTSPHFYLVAPVYVKTQCSLTPDGLEIKIHAHKALPLSNIAVSYRAGDTRQRGHYQFVHQDVTAGDAEFYELVKNVPAKGVEEARVWTFYKGVPEPLQHNWPRQELKSGSANSEAAQTATQEPVLDPDQITKKDVFIVHGRDDGAKETVARFIEKMGPNAIILHEQPDKGRTIIEKLEHYSKVGLAVVLLTPDDLGGLMKSAQPKPRARQNVIFELGYFIAQLGRSNVVALYWPGVEMPTDFSGILYILFDTKGAWRLSLAKELKSAGLDIDLNKAM